MSGDLISRSKFLEYIEGMDWYTIRYNGEVTQGASCEEVAWYKATDIYAAIENAPAVEAEPVVHAHWNGDWCSRCDELSEEIYPRCPHCGAHMGKPVKTGYCPVCDQTVMMKSYDSVGRCPTCGHHIALHDEEVADGTENY